MGQRLVITEQEKKDILGLYENVSWGMVPNPKKSFIVDLPIKDVSNILDNFLPILREIKSGYEMFSKNKLAKMWTLEKLELLSLGVYIDISLEKVNENETRVEIEVRRKVGSFDSSFEIQMANEHISNIIKALDRATDLDTLEQYKGNIKPNSIEGMGLTNQEWLNLGRPDITLMYENGFKSYKEWVDAGKPELKTPYQLKREREGYYDNEDNQKQKKKGFWDRFF